MEKKDLRVSTNIKELSSFVQSVVHKETKFTVWQNINNEKVLIPAIIQSQFLGQKKITIVFKITNAQGVNTNAKIFMASSELKLLFKGKVESLTKSSIKVSVNKKFYIHENRKHPRINLDRRNAHADIFRKIAQKDTLKAEQVRIKDISGSGCGFYITPSRAVMFQPDSKLIFNSIESVDFSQPITGTIRHVTPVEAESSLSNKLLLVGVEFEVSYKDIDTILQEVEVKNLENNYNDILKQSVIS